ncbi:signal recognition particle-docking protein FtsY [Desulfobulbus alkaliphilus]|uniref:signal recognition particle-docking protein FtsY n=1 Tax=Desulfobulbus alkaliphilus TaxID=869814 RepID=UPI00196300FB|nr:signal recognition particle-docking protein FtsY [Desulfobulbus alkaliphilus]MBM9537640.1 signal recognition particle-docking protein FtsY [Desulfobulbus alkaliphilus]
MLGWFKKKFGKQADEAPPREPAEEAVAAARLPEEGVEPAPDSPPPSSDSASAQVAEPADHFASKVPTAPTAGSVALDEDERQSQAADQGSSAEVVRGRAGREAIEITTTVVVEEDKPLVGDGSDPLPGPRGEAGAEEVAMESAALAEEARDPVLREQSGSEDISAATTATGREPGPADATPAASGEPPVPRSMFQRLQERLGKTRDALVVRLDRLFLGKKEIDQDLFDQLEEILITADLGVATTMELLDQARAKVKRDQLSDPQALKTILRDQLLGFIEAADQPAELVMPDQGPFVIMVVGVNGVGKTTTIGKMAAKFTRAGQSVLLVAGDTFRAAAINQLKIWGDRVGVEVFARQPGDDPSSVAFDSLEYGLVHNFDVIIMDTAGRLHTSVNLMEELKKIKRVIGKKLAGAPHEVMLVLDATTGQNGVSQARLFHEAVGVSGLALTKLDGTAKGGIIANVCREARIPVRFIGIGEQIDDLRDFDAREFVDALFDHKV